MTPFFPQTVSIKSLRVAQARQLAALEEVLSLRKLDPKALERHRTERMRSLLIHAYETIPFYRRKYDRAGFHPGQFRSVEDIGRIPILTKNELRTAPVEDMTGPKMDASAQWLATSGSSGSPVKVWRDQHSMDLFSAYNLCLYYEWCEGKPMRNVLYFLDPTPHTMDYALAEQLRSTVSEERIISAFAPVEIQIEKMVEIRPEFVSSYPTTMRNIAAWLESRTISAGSLRLLHLTSEAADESTRRLLKRVFPNARIVDTYTSTEAGLIACPCLTDGGYHIPESQVWVEILDDEDHPTDESGRIVVTDLANRATPIIRYAGLDDYCRWADTPCKCGSTARRVAEIEGRIVDSIVLADGSRVSPYVVTNALGHVEGVAAYQVIQEKPSSFAVRIVPDAAWQQQTGLLKERIADVLSKALGETVSCEVVIESEIKPAPGRHKLPLVISRIARGG